MKDKNKNTSKHFQHSHIKDIFILYIELGRLSQTHSLWNKITTFSWSTHFINSELKSLGYNLDRLEVTHPILGHKFYAIERLILIGNIYTFIILRYRIF